MSRLFLVSLVACNAAVDPPLPPPEADLPIEPRFQPLVQQIETERQALGVSGVSVLVMERGTVTFAHGFGTKKPGGDPVDAATLFRIGSVTKMLTTTAVLEQLSEGKLALDDRVTKIVPSFKLAAGDPSSITIRHLLTHSTGLDDYLGDQDAMTRTDSDLAAFTANQYSHVAYQMAPAGRFWNYSNPNFVLAGLVAETLDDKPYRDVVHDRVLAPLAMDRTTFLPADAIADGNFAYGVTTAGEVQAPDAYDNAWGRPAGFAFSSVYDLAKFARFLNEGDAVLGDPQRVAMASAQIDMQVAKDFAAYGYGLFVEQGAFLDDGYHATRIVEHGGDIYGFSADLYTVPATDFAVVVLVDKDYSHFYDTIDFALQRYASLPAPTTPPDFTIDAGGFPALAGSYQDTFNVGRVAITANQLDLSISMPDLDAAGVAYDKTLTPVAPDNFLITIEGYQDEITFIRDPSGKPEYIRDRFFVARRGASAKPSQVDRPALLAKLRETAPTRRSLRR